jgi:hypothetical protein
VSSVFERSPGWAPWESHPADDRRNVASVPCGGVLAATAHEAVDVALVKALLDANIPSNTCAESGSFPSTTESGGRAGGTAGPLDDDLHGGVASA